MTSLWYYPYWVTCISPLLKSPPTKSPPLGRKRQVVGDGWSTAYDAWVYANNRLRTMETEMSTIRHAVDCKSLLTYNGDFTFLPSLVTTTELIDVSSRSQSLVCLVVYHLNLQFASHWCEFEHNIVKWKHECKTRKCLNDDCAVLSPQWMPRNRLSCAQINIVEFQYRWSVTCLCSFSRVLWSCQNNVIRKCRETQDYAEKRRRSTVCVHSRSICCTQH